MKKLLLVVLMLLLSMFVVSANTTTVESSGYTSELNSFTSCSIDYRDNIFVLVMFAFIIFLYTMAFLTKQYIIGVFASLALVFISLSIFTCFIAFGMALLSSSIILLLYFVFAKV